MQMKLTSISIIIVNWNAGPQLVDCLESIRILGGDCVESVIVVDNASSDGSLAGLGLFGLPLQVIRNAENRGFAAACNQGASVATGDYLLFLNPDTRLFENSLMIPLVFMERPENMDVGVCGIQLLDESGYVARSCSRFPSLGSSMARALGLSKLPWFHSLEDQMKEWDHSSIRDVDQVIGAFFLVRKSAFQLLTGFDERFFVYFEEVDFALRSRQAGWRSVFLADARAFHAGGGTSRQVKAHRLFYSLRSRLLYGFKHFKPWQAWVLSGVSLGLEPFSRLVFSILRGAPGDVRNTLNAYGMMYHDVPNILKTVRKL
jgi:GT2 family glycosyltransferase